MNYERQSIAGLTPAFPIMNIVGFTCLLLQYVAFYYSPLIRYQYRARNNGEETTTRLNDVLFAVHALVLSWVTFSQFWQGLWGFEKSRWKVSKVVYGIMSICMIGVAVTVGIVVVNGKDGGRDPAMWAWIDVVKSTLMADVKGSCAGERLTCVQIYAFGTVKLAVTFVKYIPQVWANYKRQSTVGWSIAQILMDFVGGILSIAQLVIDSSLQSDWSGITSNPVKLGLGQTTIAFDVIFMLQHYVFYKGAEKVEEDGDARRRDSSGGESGRGLIASDEEEEMSR